MNYKLIISNYKVYREIELTDTVNQINIGTVKGCEIRLRREDFFEDFTITLLKINGQWSFNSTDNIYISVDGIRKLWSKDLISGDSLNVYYTKTDSILFNVWFYNDFELETQEYDSKIQLNQTPVVKIGTNAESDIIISSQFVEGELFRLTLKEQGYLLEEEQTDVGVYINARKLQNSALLQNRDFISVAEYGFYYQDGELYYSNQKKIQLPTLKSCSIAESRTVLEYPKYNRSTRVKIILSKETIEILDPPQNPQKPKNNVILSLLPSVLMLFMIVFMNNSSGNHLILSVGTMVVGLVTSVGGICMGKKEYKQSQKERVEKYHAYITQKEKEIKKIRADELNNLRDMYYSLERDIENLENFSGKLFDRLPEDEDFLYVYLGVGKQEAAAKIDYKKQEKFSAGDELTKIPEELCKKYKYLPEAPIVVDYRNANAVGVISKKGNKYGIFKNMLLDMALRQYYTEVCVFLLVDEVQLEKVKWIRFLPHLYTGEARNIACDMQSRNNIFEYLYKELCKREAEGDKQSIHLVIYVFKELGIKNHPISRFIENASKLNVTFVFFEEEADLLPLHCGNIIYIEQEGKGLLLQTGDKTQSKEFEYKIVDDKKMEKLVKKLAPIYCEEISLESTLKKSISLFELLGIYSVEDLDLQENWHAAKVYETMAAPLGVNAKEDIVYLDLHEKAHGPHGLVAGTTGSGKSEILQTYILSIITAFPPSDVGFMIIDFKGGGMVNQLKELPHLLGSITNIDGRQIERSLKSIRAELVKRQELFAQAEVNHIDKYIKLFKANKVQVPLPHLVIIVDEFAEVKAEQPEFMKELISAARIGRSLGVHLILATQKPAGQVDEQIWSNSRFKLCLKVQTSEDSNEMLKSPLAAEIREPGRAYFQVGNNEIFELFQSGYSGAPEKTDIDSKIKEFNIKSVDYIGNKMIIYQQKKEKTKAVQTQLDILVDYVTDFCQTHSVIVPDKICLPPLENRILFDKQIAKSEKDMEMSCVIGVYDDPEGQYQGNAEIRCATDNISIIGSTQYGKTNLLQTIIRDLANRYSPKELNIYIIDFASMVLKNFEGLHHVGGVVTAAEDEKLKNLFKYLREQVRERREILLTAGVSSFMAYKEAGKAELPQIILIVDNLSMLKEMYLEEDDVLLELSREGISVGISIIVSNTQASGIGYKYMANFSSKIALFNNDEGEYMTLLGNGKMSVEPIPGRCLIEYDKKYYDCQIFQAFSGEKEYERVNAIGNFIEKINNKYMDEKAKAIPEIPEVLTSEHLDNMCNGEARDIVLGLDYETVKPVIMNCIEKNSLVLSGGEKSGKTNFIKYLLRCLWRDNENLEIYIADNYKKKLQDISLEVKKQEYILLSERMGEVICDIERRMEHKRQRMLLEKDHVSEDNTMIIFIFNSVEIIESISENMEVMEAYTNLMVRYRGMGVFSILGNFPNVQILYDAPEILKMGKDSGQVIYFDDIEKLKFVDIPFNYLRQYKKRIGLGDAFYINESDVVKIKTPLLVN